MTASVMAFTQIVGTRVWQETRRQGVLLLTVVFVAIAWFYFTPTIRLFVTERGSAPTVVARNSTFALCLLFGVLGMCTAHFTASMFAEASLKDRRTLLSALVAVSPLHRAHYRVAIFVAASFLSLFPSTVFLATANVVQRLPNREVQLLPPNLENFLVAYLQFYLPLAFAIGAFSFLIAERTGSLKLVYAAATVPLIAYVCISRLTQSVEHQLLAFADPTGITYLATVARDGKRTVELNQLQWMLDPSFVLNRVALLLGGAACVFGAAVRKNESRHYGRTAESIYWQDATTKSLLSWVARIDLGERKRAAFRPLLAICSLHLRLLLRERSVLYLLALTPLIVWITSWRALPPFNAVGLPKSSQVAANSSQILLLYTVIAAIFVMTECFFRDRDERVNEITDVYPISAGYALVGKTASAAIVAVLMLVVGTITGFLYQRTHANTPLEWVPFVYIYGGLLLPTAILAAAQTSLTATLTRTRLATYTTMGMIVSGFGLLAIQGWHHWIYNVSAESLTLYSDILGFGPWSHLLLVHRVYVIAIAVSIIAVAVVLQPRFVGQSIQARLKTPSRTTLTFLMVSLAAAAGSGAWIFASVSGGLGNQDYLRAEYETEVRPFLVDQPRPAVTDVQLVVDLFPEARGFAVSGTYTVENKGLSPISTIYCTVNPKLLEKGNIQIEPQGVVRQHSPFVVALDPVEPLLPGKTARVTFGWSGRAPEKLPSNGGRLDSYVTDNAAILHSLASWHWLPVVGYSSEAELQQPGKRREYGLPDAETSDTRKSASRAGYLDKEDAYTFAAKVTVPSGMTALTVGNLTERRNAGGRSEFTFRSEHPIRIFPVVVGRWEHEETECCRVWYNERHPENVHQIIRTLTASHNFYNSAFSPYPARMLSVVEMPGIGSLGTGFPTVIPISEEAAFLTGQRGARPNLLFLTIAHEVAHQWWGGLVWPANAPGSRVLTEGLATYSALIAADELLPPSSRQMLFEDFEYFYVRYRLPDDERPLSLVDGTHRADRPVMYQRAGMVFYMLHHVLGPEVMLGALREFIEETTRHSRLPVIADLLAIIENRSPRSKPLLDQFVRGMAIPNPQFVKLDKTRMGTDSWNVTFTISNRGSGDVPVTVSAVGIAEGQRREVRTVISMTGSAPVSGQLDVPFDPRIVEIDPERVVLLEQRRTGRRRL